MDGAARPVLGDRPLVGDRDPLGVAHRVEVAGRPGIGEERPVRRLHSVPDEPVEIDPEIREQAIADIRARLAQHDGDDPGSAA